MFRSILKFYLSLACGLAGYATWAAAKDRVVQLKAPEGGELVFSPRQLESVPMARQTVLDDSEIDFDGAVRFSFDERFYSLLPLKLTLNNEDMIGSDLCTFTLFEYFNENVLRARFLSGIAVDEGQRQMILTMRPGVEFARLNPETKALERRQANIQDINFSIDLSLREFENHFVTLHEGVIEKKAVIDEQSLMIQWSESRSSLSVFELFRSMNINLVSAEQYAGFETAEPADVDKSPLMQERPFCSGFYVIDNVDSDRKNISYQRVDNHWMQKATGFRPAIKKYAYTFAADSSANISLYRANLIDWVESPDNTELEPVLKSKNRSSVMTQLKPGPQMARLNAIRTNASRLNPEVQKAVAEVVRNYRLFQVLERGEMGAIYSVMPHLGFENSDEQFLTADQWQDLSTRYGLPSLSIENQAALRNENEGSRGLRQSLRRAHEILVNAGFEFNERGQFLDKETKKPIILTALATSETEKFFGLLKHPLKTLGLGLETVLITSPAHLGNLIKKGEFDLYSRSYASAWFFSNSLVKAWFHSSQGFATNLGINDPNLDQIIDLLPGITNEQDWILLTRALGERLVSAGNVMPIRYSFGTLALHPENLAPRIEFTKSPWTVQGPTHFNFMETWAIKK